jgi:hypothetical protein
LEHKQIKNKGGTYDENNYAFFKGRGWNRNSGDDIDFSRSDFTGYHIQGSADGTCKRHFFTDYIQEQQYLLI